MKRQRGRNRKPGTSGGGNQNNPNRAFESNGPEGGKIRGNAQHVYERYQQLARDAFSSGDRVLAENYLQHAEHYFRLMRTIQPARPVTEIVARDNFASGFDIDFEDEQGNPIEYDGTATVQGDTEGGDQQAQGQSQGYQQGGQGQNQGYQGGQNQGGQQNQPREDRGEYRRDRDNRDRDRDGNREFRNDRDRDRPRDDRPRDDRPRDDRPRDERPRDDRPRDDRPRDDRPRDDQPRAEGQGGEGEGRRREGRRDRFERRRDRPRDDQGGGEPRSADPLAVVEPRGADLPTRDDTPRAPKPRFRDEDGGHTPAFLGRAAPIAATAPAASDEAAAEKPKRAPRKKKVADEAPAE